MHQSLPHLLYHLLLAVVLAGCATTRPIGEWRDESFSGGFDRILVMSVTVSKERRRIFEDQFVAGLGARDISATQSYLLLASSPEPTREEIEKAIEGRNIGAILVTRLAGVRPAEVYRLPDNYDHDRNYATYYGHASRQMTPGYLEDYRVLTLDTRLYEAASGELVWRMQSETIDSPGSRDIIAEQIELAIRTLAKRGLLASGS
jgi:hypothetical protein